MDKYMLKCFTMATGVLPESLWRGAYTLTELEKIGAEEFRIRAGRQFAVMVAGRAVYIFADGLPLICTREHIEEALARGTKSSVHAFNHQIKQGFVSLEQGGRMGVCGTIIEEQDRATMGGVSSLNIRIAKQISGVSADIFDEINWAAKPNILIISPAGGGKTTFLRDIIKRVSDSGAIVGLADQRGEVAACYDGVPSFDVGKNTDVITGGDKSVAIDILLRSMTPGYIGVDEITREADAHTLMSVVATGAGLIATAHAESFADLNKRPIYRELMSSGVFNYVITINNIGGRREYLLREIGGNI